ncbi:DOC domain and unchracterized virulence related domain [Candidatus Nitrospira inopinata]|uniref:DOC domain and unchracterized virulence related domain n=1 Tax=Candidatus Nitrospira inopinata TaxID=1715989 RepID=A0A0S4KZ20_9BACT|nr:virulence protein RhuM/Fic/DOC family protein [Candidatus Nitrospira inopinata]CUQ67830.1 DOC domain and unchracterized virulence related domain [Candidatus Nitrospira inopinata]
MKPVSAIVIYEGENARVEVRIEHDNVWLNLQQVADLFGRDKSVISRHLKNIFDTKELERDSVVAKNATTAADGKTYLVDYYNLDAIISVGYRVNSTRATRFRQWATRVLREHLTKGYTLNRQRFEQNARELEATLALVRKAAAGEVLTTDQGRGLVDIIARYTQTFLLLQHYDEGLLAEPKGVPGGVLPTAQVARAAIARLKAELIQRGEASELFGRERDNGLTALLGNLDQTVLGAPAYPTIESKAAHLLYFVIKDHPFVDGNKRIGSFLFVEFLDRNGRLFRDGEPVITTWGWRRSRCW